MFIQPYLYFDGRCQEAIDFYKQTLGATVEMLMHFKDSPDQSMTTPGTEDKVMHASVKIGDSSVLMSDGNCTNKTKFDGFALTISVHEVSEADRLFNALSQGGQVTMPLTETFFSPRFGMTGDKFGVQWIIIVAPPMPQ